jgi:hypothetical protein
LAWPDAVAVCGYVAAGRSEVGIGGFAPATGEKNAKERDATRGEGRKEVQEEQGRS